MQTRFAADSLADTSFPFQGSLPIRAGQHTLQLRIWPIATDPGILHIDQVTIQVQVLPALG
jgi:hypothetical protein